MHVSSKSLAIVGAVFAAWLGAVAWDHAQNAQNKDKDKASSGP